MLKLQQCGSDSSAARRIERIGKHGAGNGGECQRTRTGTGLGLGLVEQKVGVHALRVAENGVVRQIDERLVGHVKRGRWDVWEEAPVAIITLSLGLGRGRGRRVRVVGVVAHVVL